MEWVKNEKGRPMLIYEGHLYNKLRLLASGIEVYECSKRRNYGCKAALDIECGKVANRKSEHTHSPDIGQVEAVKAKAAIREKAATTQDTPQQIISEIVSAVSLASTSHLPDIRSLRRGIRRLRQKKDSMLPPLPRNAQELLVPPDFTNTLSKQKFLLFDSGKDAGQRILIFSTEANLDVLKKCDHWFADGTFSVSPEIIFQFYTIQVLRDEHCIPCVYALLPNKQEATYKNFLEQLILLKPGLNPSSVTLDFEKAVVNAFVGQFPAAEMHGCYFHFCQDVYRKVQSEGLQAKYCEDSNFALEARKLAALAFLPPSAVPIIFDDMRTSLPNELNGVAAYVEETYIGKPIPGGSRRRPIFGLSLWNVHDKVLSNLLRTNNSIEGNHRHLQDVILCHKPSIWKLLRSLQQEQGLNESILERLLEGKSPPPKRRRYIESDARLFNIVNKFLQMSPNEYLNAIAHNIRF